TKLAMRDLDTSSLGSPLSKHVERQSFVNNYFDSLVEADSGVQVLDPIPHLCAGDFCPVAKNGTSLYKDEDHLSLQGAKMIAEMFEEMFQSIQKAGSSQ
ncbi:MAG: SGNH hydrolase domain-containing protein, partial [Pseudomonadota bacterium]|nr:SGNH hydrolase domain-containing protein [Pseudomonadota bacterium]